MKSRHLMASPAPRTTSDAKKKISHFWIENCAVRYIQRVMSALGQKRTLRLVRSMSALPPESGHRLLTRLSHQRSVGEAAVATTPV
jgi:hypothetical protein